MPLDADDPVVTHYNDGNRAFIQAFMARGTLTLKQAKPILAAIFTIQDGSLCIPMIRRFVSTNRFLGEKETLPEDVTEADFNSFVSAAMDALSPFDFEIRSTFHQVSKERIYAIINSTSDALTQIATTRSAEEIAFIKRILDAMFETYNTPRQEIMGVTSMQALKLAKANQRNRQSGNASQLGDGGSQSVDKGLSVAQAERLLKNMVEEGWLERSKDGWYTLSVRALLELKNWLVATYNDPDADGDGDAWQRIKFCQACKEIVTIGQRCKEPDCNVRLHDICHAAFWKTRREQKCPKCETEWDGRHWVGERAITTTESYSKGKRRSGGSKRSDAARNEAEEIEV